ncbi:C1 family peptidase [Candidatus Eisenbacteria bacterium]|uniref:C1 family peptidase n=1 Tax=Eiseniibacteriota bacterium TaxID=2212470 RepID=A0ABV6YK54_UNCEI
MRPTRKLAALKILGVALYVFSVVLMTPNALAVPRLGVANQAALYCQALGCEYEIVKTEDGERGICVLPNGVRCDAWDFLRGFVGQEYSYCALQGYGIVTKDIGSGSFASPCAYCVLSDGTEVGTVTELMGLTSGSGFNPDLATSAEVDAPVGVTSSPIVRDLPSTFDWRDLNGCTSIKNQGSCGSCWAFGTVGPLECNILIKDGIEVDLSEQWLVSCNSDGWDCGGGYFAHDYHQWKTDPCGDSGALREVEFRYAADDLPCDCPYEHSYWVESWAYIGGSSSIPPVDEIKQAILNYGPVSVAVRASDAFSDYTDGVFDQDEDLSCNHAVVLVGWDDAQGTEGVWFLRNSWGPGWGEDGYMRIEYGICRVGTGACWVEYREPMAFSFPNGMPEALLNAVPTTVDVEILEFGDTCIPGSEMLHYRYDGGAFQTTALAPAGRGLYQATFPPPLCDDTPEFYLSAEGVNCGTFCSPEDAPVSVYTALVGTLTPIVTDDFETDNGWSVENDAGLADGAWDRGIPAGGGTRGDPPTDYDGSGRCYLTDNVEGNSDVDGGITWLLSPVFDLSDQEEAMVNCAIWYTNYFGADPNNDLFKIYVSDDNGGNWHLAQTLGPQTSPGWAKQSFVVGSFVNLTNQVRVRFEASDLGDGSVVEAGVDDFRVMGLSCGISDITDADMGGGFHQSCAPNPFGTATTIRYALCREEAVSVNICCVTGRVVRTLVDHELQAAGGHAVSWDGRDDRGQRMPSGVYYSNLDVAGKRTTRAMILIE